MNTEKAITAANAANVRLIRFLYCDDGGVIRGKLARIDSLAKRLETCIGLTVAVQAINILDRLQPLAGMGPVGGIRLAPGPGSFAILPYASGSAALAVGRVPTELS